MMIRKFSIAVLSSLIFLSVAQSALWSYPGMGSWNPPAQGTQYAPNLSTVSMEAIPSESPDQITLKIYSTANFQPANVADRIYDVYRKDPDAATFGVPIGVVTGQVDIVTWVDSTAVVGVRYEYGLGIQGQYGSYPNPKMVHANVIAGIKVDMTEEKGRMAIVVTDQIVARLPVEYAQYKEDLVLDGWAIDEIVVARAGSYVANGTGPNDANGVPTGPFPTNHVAIRNQLQTLYNTYPGELKNVVLIGQVPVVRSGAGYVGPDGHGNRSSCGADAYYADMDGIWSDTYWNVTSYSGDIAGAVKEGKINVQGDSKFDTDYMASMTPNNNLELGFGRIDFSNQIAAEYESTRNYFNKLHRYKMAGVDFQPGRKAMHRTLFGMVSHAFLASIPGVVGMTECDFLTKSDLPADPPAGSIDGDADAAYTRDTSPYLFYFKGDGGPGASHGSRAVFWTGLQSHWGYWFETAVSSGQNKMQRRLAEDNFSLSYTWYISISSTPAVNYLYHRLGMGGNAGDMMRVSMSDRTGATSPYSYAQAPMFMNHMGDPALRIYMFAPPTDLQALPNGGSPSLSWTASVAPVGEPQVLGYHVYRSANAAGPFTRLTSSIVAGTTYTDATATSGEWHYQVKAVRLETCGGGTYYNSSLATQQSVDLVGSPAALAIDTSGLPDANWDTDYEVQLIATGGTPNFTWSANTTPPGLTLSTSGILSGKPAADGVFVFNVSVTDALGGTNSAQQTLTVSELDVQTVLPEASGYVAKSVPTYTSRHYEPALQISGGPTYVDSGYVRFDLSNIHTNDAFVQAKLVLMVDGLTPSNSPIIIKAALSEDAADGWQETTLTYNNRPADNTGISVVTTTNLTTRHEQIVLDITDLVLDTLENDPSQILTVRLFSETPANWGQSVRIANRYATSLAQPTLLVQTIGSEPFLSAQFSATPLSGGTPLNVAFTDSSSGIITNRFWDFGDGITTNTTTAGIAHTYTSAGDRTVQLIVSGTGGASTNTQANLIHVTVSAPPTASFSATPTSGEAPLVVSFTDNSTGTIANRFWDFGDGITTNIAGTAVSHTYTGVGTYTVELIVSGAEGASTNTQVDAISVTPTAPPTANFSATPTSGFAPLAVAFTDTSTGNITTRLWDFGDGTTTNIAGTAVAHTYTGAGTYTVELIVTGAGGASTNTQANLISATEAPPSEDIVISAEILDQQVRGNGTTGTSLNWVYQQEDQISGAQSGEIVVPFELPDLGGDTINSANLLAALNSPTWQQWGNVDVYGVRYASSAAVLLSDYAPFSDSAGNGTKIMDNFYVSGSGTATYQDLETDATGDAALATWLTDQYTAGAVAGDYVFLRFQPDDLDAINDNAIAFATADTVAETTPTLTLVLGSGGSGSTINDWRLVYFGTTNNSGSAADDADPAGDGYPNLLKYAMGLVPTNNYDGSPIAPHAQMQDPHGFTYTFTHDTGVSDATLMVEGAFNLVSNVWVNIDPLDPANQVDVQADTPEAGIETITIKDTQPNATNRFLRLKATRP